MFKSVDGATVDHIIPLSLNGEPLDESNLTVCYHNCNKPK